MFAGFDRLVVHTCLTLQMHALLPQFHTMKHIALREGRGALWAGLRPRVLFHIPAAAITWSSYETMKSFLSPEAAQNIDGAQPVH